MLEEAAQAPQAGVGCAPGARGEEQRAFTVGLEVVEGALVTDIGGLLLQSGHVVHLDLPRVGAGEQVAAVWHDGAGGETGCAVVLRLFHSDRADGAEAGVDQFPVQLAPVWASERGEEGSPRVAGGEVPRGGVLWPRVRALVRDEQVELWASGHGVLAQAVLGGEVVAHDGDEVDAALLLLRRRLQLGGRGVRLEQVGSSG